MGPRRSEGVKPLMGLGILTTDGERWAHSRRMVKPTFNRAQVSDRGMFEKHFERFLRLLPRDGSTVQMSSLFSQLVCYVCMQKERW
jgi:cytochrome P450